MATPTTLDHLVPSLSVMLTVMESMPFELDAVYVNTPEAIATEPLVVVAVYVGVLKPEANRERLYVTLADGATKTWGSPMKLR
jgi:hypothetical protein